MYRVHLFSLFTALFSSRSSFFLTLTSCSPFHLLANKSIYPLIKEASLRIESFKQSIPQSFTFLLALRVPQPSSHDSTGGFRTSVRKAKKPQGTKSGLLPAGDKREHVALRVRVDGVLQDVHGVLVRHAFLCGFSRRV